MGTFPGMLPPPPGQEPNFANPESVGWQLILCASLCIVGAIVFVSVRMYTAHFVAQKVRVDDWLILPALVFMIMNSAVNIAQTQNGVGRHMWDVTPEMFTRFVIFGIPAAISYNLSTAFIKSSIIYFYLRFAEINRPFRLVAYCLLFVIIGNAFTSGFPFLWLCNPMNKFWDPTVEGTCNDFYTPYLASAAINSSTDVVLLVMPLWLLKPLRVSWKQKVAISVVLMTGGFVSAVSFVRLAAIPLGKDYNDMTWAYCTNLIWCIIEMTVGIVCACLPCLRALAKHHFPDAFRWLDRPEPSNYGVIYAISMRIRSWRWTDRGSRTRVASSTFTDTRKSGGHRPLGSAAMEVDGVGLRGDVSVDGHLPEGTGEV